jgi:hypothetical protein
MADRGRVLGTLRFIAPTIEDEWHHADILIAELKEWDVRQSEALGFDGNEVTSVFYPGDIRDIRRDSVPPEGCLLLAIAGSLPVGCAAYRRLTSNACELYDVRHTCSDVAAAFERRDFRRARAGTPAPWRAPAGSCQRERDAHCRGVPSVLRGPLPWGQYRQVPFVVYKTPWINRIMIDSEVERSSTTRTSSGRWSALENADRVFQHEAPRDRAMRQLIRLLNPQLRAQRPLRGCLQGEFHAHCCYAGYRGWHL